MLRLLPALLLLAPLLPVASSVAADDGCAGLGASSCWFVCRPGDTLVASLTGSGGVTATCGGATVSCSPGVLGSCTQRSAPVPADPDGAWVLWGECVADAGASGAYACAAACEGCGAERVLEACAGVVDGGESSCRFLCGEGVSILYVSFAGAGSVTGTCATTGASCSPGDAGVCTQWGGGNDGSVGTCTGTGRGAFACSMVWTCYCSVMAAPER